MHASKKIQQNHCCVCGSPEGPGPIPRYGRQPVPCLSSRLLECDYCCIVFRAMLYPSCDGSGQVGSRCLLHTAVMTHASRAACVYMCAVKVGEGAPRQAFSGTQKVQSCCTEPLTNNTALGHRIVHRLHLRHYLYLDVQLVWAERGL